MSSLNLTASEIFLSLQKKLNLQNIIYTREIRGDYYLDGKMQFRVTMPNIHGGKKSISPGWLKACRGTVRLSTSEYADLVRCPMSGEEYNKIIRNRFKIK
jgi:hypothetical protein